MAKLEDLLVSGQDIDQDLVAGILAPILRIDKDSCTIRPLGQWRSISNEARILSYLLARKAMIALALPLEREQAPPSEIISVTGIPSGSVYPTLKGLYERRPQLVDKNGQSRYFVPGWAVDVVCQYIRSQLESQGGQVP
jgi:hypothetical protein